MENQIEEDILIPHIDDTTPLLIFLISNIVFAIVFSCVLYLVD